MALSASKLHHDRVFRLSHNNQLLIVIATFNEIENLPRLIVQLVDLLPAAQILIIDDASPDGTGNWCDEARVKYPQLSVVHREGKLGLGSATLVGFHRAIARGFDMVATMDADLSHDPASLVKLVETLQHPENQHAGVAIGSRYVEGGGIIGWPWYRKLASRAVNLFARWNLGLKTKDNSGAFRVYRCDSLKNLDLATVRSTGYGYLEEILWRLQRSGVEMVEVPIVFHNRELGNSKTSVSEGFKVFWQIFKMGVGRW
jgi:dolichol-phosphate mannosyltransferase